MMADQVAAANTHVQRKSEVFFLLEIKTDEASLVEKRVNHRLNATLAGEEKKKSLTSRLRSESVNSGS